MLINILESLSLIQICIKIWFWFIFSWKFHPYKSCKKKSWIFQFTVEISQDLCFGYIDYSNDPKFSDRQVWANSVDCFVIRSASFGLITVW